MTAARQQRKSPLALGQAFGLALGLAVCGGIFASPAILAAPSCVVPECDGISHADPTFREALWDRYFTAAPRPRTSSELRYSDRRLRSKNSPGVTTSTRRR